MGKIIYEKQLKRMIATTDNIGIIQHSKGAVPDFNHGYSIDDVSRALIVLSRVYPRFNEKNNGRQIHKIYLDYIKNSQRDDGFFHNFYEPVNEFRTYCSKDGKLGWRIEENDKLQDCFGRVMWALAEFISSNYPAEDKKKAEKIFLEHLENIRGLRYNASRAFALLGLTEYLAKNKDPVVNQSAIETAAKLAEEFKKNSDENWKWFSNKMTYCNALFCESMIRAGDVLNDKHFLDIGKKSLDFLIEKSFDENQTFHAIGNKGWFSNKGIFPRYDQQAVEAGDMTSSCVCAYKIFRTEKYRKNAFRAFDWFFGKNIIRKEMIDFSSGGIYDAINENGINKNQGAESVLSYLLAATRLKEIF